MDVYLFVKNRITTDNMIQPANVRDRSDGRLGILPVVLIHSNIESVSQIQLNLPHNLKEAENVRNLENMYFELMRRFNFGQDFPILDPIEDMEIVGKEIEKLVKDKLKVQLELEDT
jgi:nucleoside-triphosphatase THEP1